MFFYRFFRDGELVSRHSSAFGYGVVGSDFIQIGRHIIETDSQKNDIKVNS